jgi:hypothetical protein
MKRKQGNFMPYDHEKTKNRGGNIPATEAMRRTRLIEADRMSEINDPNADVDDDDEEELHWQP